MAFGRGEFIWVDFNPQSGREQSGRRPALVISPAEYNATSSCVLVCPVSSNMAPWPWKVAIPQGGEIEGAVLVDQIKSIDARARHAEPAGAKLDELTFQEVLARLATITG